MLKTIDCNNTFQEEKEVVLKPTWDVQWIGLNEEKGRSHHQASFTDTNHVSSLTKVKKHVITIIVIQI